MNHRRVGFLVLFWFGLVVFGCTYRKFRGQGSNLSHGSDNTGSSTHCAYISLGDSILPDNQGEGYVCGASITLEEQFRASTWLHLPSHLAFFTKWINPFGDIPHQWVEKLHSGGPACAQKCSRESEVAVEADRGRSETEQKGNREVGPPDSSLAPDAGFL